MPCPEKFRESLILFGLPETLIRQINGGFEQLVSSSPKKQKAAYFQHAAEVMSAALEEDDLRRVFEWNACCKGGAREKASKAFAKKYADKSLAERIALIPEGTLHGRAPPDGGRLHPGGRGARPGGGPICLRLLQLQPLRLDGPCAPVLLLLLRGAFPPPLPDHAGGEAAHGGDRLLPPGQRRHAALRHALHHPGGIRPSCAQKIRRVP